MLRGLAGLNVVGADIVEVAPAYDHAEITGIAAAHVAYELLSLLPGRPADGVEPTLSGSVSPGGTSPDSDGQGRRFSGSW